MPTLIRWMPKLSTKTSAIGAMNATQPRPVMPKPPLAVWVKNRSPSDVLATRYAVTPVTTRPIAM